MRGHVKAQASNPLEWGYPATYLHGAALSSGWAVANCVSQYGGALTNQQPTLSEKHAWGHPYSMNR